MSGRNACFGPGSVVTISRHVSLSLDAASGDDDDDDDTRHGLSLAFALCAEGPPGSTLDFLRVLASHERG